MSNNIVEIFAIAIVVMAFGVAFNPEQNKNPTASQCAAIYKVNQKGETK